MGVAGAELEACGAIKVVLASPHLRLWRAYLDLLFNDCGGPKE